MKKTSLKLFFLILFLTLLSFDFNQALATSVTPSSINCKEILRGPSNQVKEPQESLEPITKRQEDWPIKKSYQEFSEYYEEMLLINLRTFFTEKQWENLLISFRFERHLISLIEPSSLLNPSERRQKITFNDQRQLASQSSIIQLDYISLKLETALKSLYYPNYSSLSLIRKYPAYLLAFRKFTNFIYEVVLEKRIPYTMTEYKRFTKGYLKINEVPVFEKNDAIMLFLAFAKLLQKTYSNFNFLNETIFSEKDTDAALIIFDSLHRLSQTGGSFNTEDLLALKRILLKHTTPLMKSDPFPLPHPVATEEVFPRSIESIKIPKGPTLKVTFNLDLD